VSGSHVVSSSCCPPGERGCYRTLPLHDATCSDIREAIGLLREARSAGHRVPARWRQRARSLERAIPPAPDGLGRGGRRPLRSAPEPNRRARSAALPALRDFITAARLANQMLLLITAPPAPCNRPFDNRVRYTSIRLAEVAVKGAAHWCTSLIGGNADRRVREARSPLPCLCEEGQCRLLLDSPHEPRPLAETGRPGPATGCRATGREAIESQPPERRSVSDR